MRTPPPQLPGHDGELPAAPTVQPLLPSSPLPPLPPARRRPLIPPFPVPGQPPERRRPLPDVVALRRLELPDPAPPYDDQPGQDRAASQDSLDGLGGPSRDVPRPNPTGPQRTGPQRTGQQRTGPERTGPKLGEPGHGRPGSQDAGGAWAGQFAQALAETLAGSRPARQITPWTTEQARRRIRQLGPELRADERPRVRRVITSAPDAGIVEMTVIIGVGPRIRALAVRLEQAPSDGTRPGAARRWVCTEIEAA